MDAAIANMNIKDYERGAYHSVVGTLKVVEKVFSPQLNNERDLLVYLPPSYYQGERRYPVIYMHDGQNLFDNATSFAGEWGVDETMEGLSAEGLEAIVVGVPNAGAERLNEYSPFHDPQHGGGRGEAYLRFLVATVKPIIDKQFRTLPRRRFTGLLGSSMGGLISVYAFFRYPEYFGFAGAMSPAFWFAQRAIFPYVREAPYLHGKLYMDIGTREHPTSSGVTGRLRSRVRSQRYLADTRYMHGLLVQKGYKPGETLRYLEERGALHHEPAWARRMPDALRFLLSP